MDKASTSSAFFAHSMDLISSAIVPPNSTKRWVEKMDAKLKPFPPLTLLPILTTATFPLPTDPRSTLLTPIRATFCQFVSYWRAEREGRETENAGAWKLGRRGVFSLIPTPPWIFFELGP